MYQTLNGIDAIYRSQLGLTLVTRNITTLNFTAVCIRDETKPTTCSDSIGTLSRFKNSTRPMKYGPSMLLVSREYPEHEGGFTLGRAFFGAACDPRYSFGITSDYGDDLAKVVYTSAHEFGHLISNAGKEHPNCSNCIMKGILSKNAAGFVTETREAYEEYAKKVSCFRE